MCNRLGNYALCLQHSAAMAKPPAGLRSQGDCSETDPKTDKQRDLTAVAARPVHLRRLRKRCSRSDKARETSKAHGFPKLSKHGAKQKNS